MPIVGKRRDPNMGNFSKDPMYAYASAFFEAQQNVLNECQVDYGSEPVRALAFEGARDQMRNFYMENSVVGTKEQLGVEKYQDELDMMSEAFTNDLEAVRENAVAGMANWNPLIGLSLPMHKYLMLNCVFAQAIPRFVAKAPSWTETMETRYMVTPDGRRIDIANQQNEIYDAWKSANRPVDVAIKLPEFNSVDILDEYFHVSRLSHNLSVATYISAVAVEDTVAEGDTIVKEEADPDDATKTVLTSAAATAADVGTTALVWKPVNFHFNPGYGEVNRYFTENVNIKLESGDVLRDQLYASQADNMFAINSAAGKIVAVRMTARYDASSRMLKTNRVEWQERTTFVQIPENDGITVPITPEEVKDIGALYGINQVTKYMSMIKDVMENVKDDDIKHSLDESFTRLDDDHKIVKAMDFAPRQGYYSDHLTWLQATFMNTLDQIITGMLTILRDPNMEVTVLGRPAIIRQITPVEYTYQAPSNVGPIELDFKKTVVTSDKRVYNFISSEKMFGNDNLIILLNPKNTNRIVYRLYDYQMYISNEIRDSENPSLPSITAFERYKFFEYQPMQSRLFIANPTGLREHLPNVDPLGPSTYNNNDLGSVFTHYNPETGLNEATPNVLPTP